MTERAKSISKGVKAAQSLLHHLKVHKKENRLREKKKAEPVDLKHPNSSWKAKI